MLLVQVIAVTSDSWICLKGKWRHYLCLCYDVTSLQAAGLSYTCVRVAREPVLKWGHIMMRQHFRGLGAEGNLPQYASSVMNSKMAYQELRKFQKWAPWFLRLWKWVINLGAWKSNLCRSNGTTYSLMKWARIALNIKQSRVSAPPLPALTRWLPGPGFTFRIGTCALGDLWGGFSTWH